MIPFTPSRRRSGPFGAIGWTDLGFYLAATVVMTWPVVLHLTSVLAAPVGPGDPYLNLWILGWDLRVLSTNPLAVLTGRVFQANIFHPADLSLAFSDHLVPQAVLLWPLYAISGNLVLCYNALFVFSLAASAVAMHVLAGEVTGSRWGARVAAVIWAFWPYRFAHLMHLQLQSLYLLPLVFLFLHRLVANPRRRDAVALGVAAGFQVASSAYYGIIGTIAAGAGCVLLAWAAGTRRIGRIVSRLALAALVALLVASPWIWPYWRVQQTEGFARNLYEASQHAARLGSYFAVTPENLVYGRTGWLRPAASESGGPERELFPGTVALSLALFGAWRARRSGSWPLAVSAGGVALVGLVLSLGPDGVRPLYAALHRGLFGFQAIRAPARFGVLVTFGLALLAAVGARELACGVLAGRAGRAEGRRLPGRRSVLMAGLVAVTLVEYVNLPVPTVEAPQAQTAVGQWLRRATGPGAVVTLPLGLDAENTVPMLQSLEHGRPIVNGYSGQRPGVFVALVETLNQFPSAESLWTLRDLGVRFVVVDEGVSGGAAQHAAWEGSGLPIAERARFGHQRIFELRWTEEAEARWPRPETPAPPPPGRLPIESFEEAVYRVEWLGGGHVPGVQAGQATLTAARVGRGWQFSVRVVTAPWVSRFFEADDLLTTGADVELYPLRHVQRIREGHRRLDRETVFDHTARTVRLDGVSLPMERAARDPLTALYYIRSLPLVPGSTVRLPLIEGGRSLTLDIAAGAPESIQIQGRRVDALRVVPAIRARIERRRPITSTVWISRDGRSLPLRIEVSAGFGDFRVELLSVSAR